MLHIETDEDVPRRVGLTSRPWVPRHTASP